MREKTTMEYVTGKELLKQYQKHELIDMMFKKKLTPYSPALLKPYKIVIRTGGTEYPSNPLSDNILPYIENPYSKLYLYLEEVLFDAKEVNLLHSHLNETKLIIRRDIAIAAAKKFRQDNEEMTLPDVVRAVNGYLKSNGDQPYSDKHLKRIIKDYGFPPGKSGPKSKK